VTKARTTMPLSEFTRDSAAVIARIKQTGTPAVLTENGRPSVVVVDAAEWDEAVLEDEETLAAIRRGLADVDAGRVISAEELFADKSW
jgi:prevent-host-death family protein